MMASFKFSFFLFTTVLIACALAADDKKLKCYECINCKKADKEKTKECNNGEVCYIAGNPDDETWVRGCGPEKVCDAFKDKKDVKCSTCKEDECNGSNPMAASIALISIGLAMALRYAR